MGPRAAILSSLLILVLGFAGLFLWVRSVQQGVVSEPFMGPWEALDGAPWLLPDLDGALVEVPDRPFSKVQLDLSRAQMPGGITRRRQYRVSTNAQRLRGPAIGPKDPQVARVIALGESVCHGWGVGEEETGPAQLERALAERGIRAELLNAGVPENSPPVMARWCQRFGQELEPDLLLWVRRLGGEGGDREAWREHLLSCQAALGVPVVAVLPATSSFDPLGREQARNEAERLERRLRRHGVEVIELTWVFAEAQEAIASAGGPGVLLRARGATWAVEDLATGEDLLTWPRDPEVFPDALPEAAYALFEENPAVKEPLFFDQEHPDAEGFRLFGAQLAEALAPRLEAYSSKTRQ